MLTVLLLSVDSLRKEKRPFPETSVDDFDLVLSGKKDESLRPDWFLLFSFHAFSLRVEEGRPCSNPVELKE